MDVNEARKQLEDVLEVPVRVEYFSYLTQWFRFHPTMTKEAFDEKVRSLFHSKEQLILHNNFLLALLSKAYSNYRAKPLRQVSNKGQFEAAEFADFVLPSKRAAAELFAPNSPFMSCRINIAAWRRGLEGADSKVTKLMVFACQNFLKNLTTAMVTKAKGYKVRDGKLQYGFNMPVSESCVNKSSRLDDEDTIDNSDKIQGLLQRKTAPLQQTEYKQASTYNSDMDKRDLIISSKLLYETIRDNPKLLGQHGVHSLQSMKLSFLDEADLTSSSLSSEDSDC